MKKLLLSLVLLATLVSCNDKEISTDKVEVKKVEVKKRTWPTAKDNKFYHEAGNDSITEIKFMCDPKLDRVYIENACRAVIGAAEYTAYSKPNFIPVEVLLFDGNKASLIYKDKSQQGVDIEKTKYVSLSKSGVLEEILN